MHLVYVGNSDYCKACVLAKPIIAAEAKDLDLTVTWLDTDEDYRDVAVLSIEALPTTIVMKGVLEVGRIVGALPGPSMRSKIKKIMVDAES